MKSFKVDHYDPSVYNLTLSVLLEHCPDIQKRLIDIQEKLTNGLDFTEDISNTALYKYPARTLHFSIINFATATITSEDQNEFKLKYQALIDKLRVEIEGTLNKFKSWKLSINSLHFVKKPQGSTISANVVLNNGFENDIKEELDALIQVSLAQDDKCLKFYPSGNNFAINLVRIFRELSEPEETQLIEQFERCNKGFSPFELKISKLSLVVSNNYLSNSGCAIHTFSLK